MQLLSPVHHEDKTIRLKDGRTLGYAQYGDPKGKTILYFHGGISSRLDIAFAAKYCSERNIRLIAPDRPGTGISSPRPNRSLLDWYDDIKELLDHLDIEQVPLLGWSMAGPYVLACAYKAPDRFTKVGTVGGASPFTDDIKIGHLGLYSDRVLLTCPKSMEGVLSLSLATASKMPSEVIKWSLENDLRSASTDHKIIKALSVADATNFVREAFKQGPAGVLDDYRAVRDWGFAIEDINVPVHLWHGEQDVLCPVSMAHHLNERLPNSSLNIVPDAGHFLLRDNLEHIFHTLMH